METKTLHLVIRFSDALFNVGDVVAKHNDIVNAYGKVWFGKLGSPLSYDRVNLINNQMERKVNTLLYLIKGTRKKSTVYQANIFEVTRDFPKKENKLIPKYYVEKEILKFINVWIKVGHIQEVGMSSLKNLKTINSVFPLEESIARSSSGYFLVHESKTTF